MSVDIHCIARGKFEVVRSDDSAAGPCKRLADSREAARRLATMLRHEEHRAEAHERVERRFGRKK